MGTKSPIPRSPVPCGLERAGMRGNEWECVKSSRGPVIVRTTQNTHAMPDDLPAGAAAEPGPGRGPIT
jgi:hypothetical protein